jgi:hypothetical protein
MASKEDDEVILFSPSKSDKEILQRSEDDSSEATTTSVAKGFKSSSETDPGWVMRTLGIMNAKVEELQQDALQIKKAASYREILVERKFKEQEKQITALKRKRCDSCSTPSSANSSSSGKKEQHCQQEETSSNQQQDQ